MEEHSTRLRLWLNRRIVKYELRRAILPILWFFRLYDCTICYSLLLNDSPIFPIIRFFRLLICDFSDSPSTTRFSDFSDYTILLIVSYSLIFPILWVLRDSPMILQIVILRFFRFSEFYAILRVLRDSPMFPIIWFYLHKHSYFFIFYFLYLNELYKAFTVFIVRQSSKCGSEDCMMCILRNRAGYLHVYFQIE